jgi:acetylornithine deacetylase
MNDGPSDDGFEIGYSTLHVGTINGGSALNIVPNACGFEMEIRHIPQQPAAGIIAQIRDQAARIEAEARKHFPGAAVAVDEVTSYPAMNTDPDSEVASLARTLSGHNGQRKVAFGTEGGLFQECLDLPTVICGPGDIAQAHKPDEFISEEQLSACSRFLDRMVDQLCH